MKKKLDKAGPSYWNANWEDYNTPSLLDVDDPSINNTVNRAYHDFFIKLLNGQKGLSILEIGCAGSVWMPYFYETHRANVSGLDYSEVGCEKSRQLLRKYKIPGEVYQADLFNPPEELLNKFDIVVSFGVVEHFEDTSYCLSACAKYLKPGGKLVTSIPNMKGLLGKIQRIVDKDIYNIHVPLGSSDLAKAHNFPGVDLMHCDYLMTANFNLVNSGKFKSHSLNSLLRRVLSITSKFFWWFEKKGIKVMPKNAFTSPYIISVATKESQ